MLDERFARQYRYEPPSEFPLTSPYTGIVHHLSGPKNNAHTQTFRQCHLAGRCCCECLASITFITPVGFSTTRLALVLDSLVRVSRRDGKGHFDKIALSPSGHRTPGQHRVHCCPLHRLWNSTTPSCLSTSLKHTDESDSTELREE